MTRMNLGKILLYTTLAGTTLFFSTKVLRAGPPREPTKRSAPAEPSVLENVIEHAPLVLTSKKGGTNEKRFGYDNFTEVKSYDELLQLSASHPDHNMAAARNVITMQELNTVYPGMFVDPPYDEARIALRDLGGEAATRVLNDVKLRIPAYHHFIKPIEEKVVNALNKIALHGSAGHFKLSLRGYINLNADNPVCVSFTTRKGRFEGYGLLFVDGADLGVKLTEKEGFITPEGDFYLRAGAYTHFDGTKDQGVAVYGKVSF